MKKEKGNLILALTTLILYPVISVGIFVFWKLNPSFSITKIYEDLALVIIPIFLFFYLFYGRAYDCLQEE